MSKIRDLVVAIPHRVGCSKEKAAQLSAVFGMPYDYERDEKGNEFKRKGNSIEDCAERLSVVFDLLDANARDASVVSDASQLLLLASTPDISEQELIMLDYGENGGAFDDILTVEEATKIGVMGYWNE